MIFSVHKLETFSSNPGKVHLEGLVNLLKYIRDNKTLGLNCYADIKDAPLSYLLRQTNTKTENQLMVFLILVGKIVQTLAEVQEHALFFYQCGPIYHGTHVPGPVAQSSAESDYNTECTTGMALAHFSMSINVFLISIHI